MTMRLAPVAAALFGLLSFSASGHADPLALRIGYQKIGPLVILKQQHTLEQALAAEGVTVNWVEFQSGPPLMEALNAGGIDVGFAGDTPPIFALAAGVDLVFIGSQAVTGANTAILVAKDSPIRGVADLRGHSIAFTKGSSAHYQVVQTLGSAGLSIADVKPVYLQPSDATAAFRTGRVDAWAIWDPFFAIAERDPNTRVLTDGRLAPSNSFFLARRSYATAHPELIGRFIHEITAAAEWSGQHQDELARTMSAITGVDLAAQTVAAARGVYTVDVPSPGVVAREQQVADTFLALKIIPRRVDIAAATFVPPSIHAALQESPK
jgi:aliphatic sulfonates family ABC transporter substrate-binding protein